MNHKFTNIQNYLFFVLILFFIIGIVNINFSILALICFTIPFILFFRYRDKIWCKYYCPRAGFFTKIIGKISLRNKMPKVLNKKQVKIGFVIYFALNLFIITMSTVGVGSGKMPPMAYVRFLLFFKAPFKLPQLIDFSITPWFTHLGYRIYSMMFTTSIIGIVLGILFAPRTWCVICPVSTLTSKPKK